jgi:hypothetical protein
MPALAQLAQQALVGGYEAAIVCRRQGDVHTIIGRMVQLDRDERCGLTDCNRQCSGERFRCMPAC